MVGENMADTDSSTAGSNSDEVILFSHQTRILITYVANARTRRRPRSRW